MGVLGKLLTCEGLPELRPYVRSAKSRTRGL
jgi:hypothetical protein